MDADPATLVVPADVAWCQDGATIAVGLLPSGPVLVLEGPAVLLWQAIAEHGDAQRAIRETVAAVLDAPADAADHLRAVPADLRSRGALAPVSDLG